MTTSPSSSNEYGTQVTLRELRSVVPVFYEQRQPIFLWGSPGIGKSDTLKEVARIIGLPFHLVQLNLMDVPDVLGLPFIRDGYTEWCPPAFIPREPVLVVLDEMNSAAPSVQVAANLLLLEKRWGSVSLHPDSYVLGAGNCAIHRAVVQPMPTSTRNRLAHFMIHPSEKEWIEDYGITQGFDSLNLAFIAAYPDWLSRFSPDQHAFPSPRSWSAVFRLPEEQQKNYKIVASLVGEGAAAQFRAWHELTSKLPKVSAVIKSPDKTPVPEDMPSKWALVGILGMQAQDPKRTSYQDVSAITRYVGRFGGQEFMTFFGLPAMRSRPQLFIEVPELSRVAEQVRKYRENAK